MLDRMRTGWPSSSDSRRARAASRVALPSCPVQDGLRFSVMLAIRDGVTIIRRAGAAPSSLGVRLACHLALGNGGYENHRFTDHKKGCYDASRCSIVVTDFTCVGVALFSKP